MRRAKRWHFLLIVIFTYISCGEALRLLKTSSTTTTTTTTSTTPTPETPAPANDKESANGTKGGRKLTGIPQIDWVWDPNLPRELNGYNLSSYPFFNTPPPPAEIAFKCDGLHDGFYASIEYKCQIYHHCVYGIRHDFICANFTAFDQKTFICHFVSDVDCENSEKYWSRNDALYMATTTTTTSTTTTTTTPSPYRRNRRPLRRRRPSDYYYDEDYDDDYYEEDRRPNRRRNQRPRGRRPIDDEDYDDRKPYSDEDYKFDKRPKNRNRFKDTDDADVVDRRIEPRTRPKGSTPERRKSPPNRKLAADHQDSADERRSFSDDRGKPKNKLDEVDESYERRPHGRRRYQNEKRIEPEDEDYDKPSQGSEPDSEEALPEPKVEKIRPVLSGNAASSSIYDRPRVPPKIPRPVPIHEKRKYSYQTHKATTTTSTISPLGDDYYDAEYNEDNASHLNEEESEESYPRKHRDEVGSRHYEDDHPRRPQGQSRHDNVDLPRKRRPNSRRRKPFVGDDYDDDDENLPPRKRPHSGRNKFSDYSEEDDLRDLRPRRRENVRHSNKDLSSDEVDKIQKKSKISQKSPVAKISDDDAEDTLNEKSEETVDNEKTLDVEDDKPPRRENRPQLRVIKRPLLPSRGGSPYLPRGLQPVGAAVKQATTQATPIDVGPTVSGAHSLEHRPPLVRPNIEKGPRTTQQPQVLNSKATLDELYANDYDVTLNDALNPTLKPISSSNPNSYFSSFANRDSETGDNDDSKFSSSDVRRRTSPRKKNRLRSRPRQEYYDDQDY